jgi:diguanylate cyclase (GGDEF)-like protein
MGHYWWPIRIFVIGIAFVLVGLVALNVSLEPVAYWYLFLAPVTLCAVSFGLRGALVGAFCGALAVLGLLRVHYLPAAAMPASRPMVETVAEATYLALRGQVVGTIDPALLTQMTSGDITLRLILGWLLVFGTGVLTGWVAEHNRRTQAALLAMAHRLATTDGLTGLLNYRAFRERLEHACTHLPRRQRRFALVLIDLSTFKDLNDRHGHLAGDRALQAVAHALATNVRACDVACRYGGDEFAVLIDNVDCHRAVDTATRLKHAAEELGATLRESIPAMPPLRLSVGVALAPDDASGSDQLIACADRAMYMAKAAGSWDVVAYSPTLREHDGILYSTQRTAGLA